MSWRVRAAALPAIVSMVVLLGGPATAVSGTDVLPPDPSEVADESLEGEPDDTDSVAPYPLAPEADRFESDALGVVTYSGAEAGASNPWSALECAAGDSETDSPCVSGSDTDSDLALENLEARLGTSSYARTSAAADPTYVPLPDECIQAALDNGGFVNIVQRFSACHIVPTTIDLTNAKNVTVGEARVMIYAYAFHYAG